MKLQDLYESVIKLPAAKNDQELHDRIKALKDAGIEAGTGAGNNQTDIVVDRKNEKKAKEILKKAGLMESTINVEFVRDTSEDMVQKAVKKHNVSLSKKDKDHKMDITGEKKDILNFLASQGWNRSDMEKWYPELHDSEE